MNIVTFANFPPIPTRRFDWQAVSEDYEPGDPIGYGETKEAARADLLAQIEDATTYAREQCETAASLERMKD